MAPSFSFSSTDKCDSWSNYQLNQIFTSTDRDFDSTIKFNSSTGKELLTLNNRQGGTEVANAKLYGLLRTFPTFLPDQQARVGSFTPKRSIFAWHITSVECTDNKNCLHEGGFDRYLRASINARSDKWSCQTHKSLAFLEIHHLKTLWIQTFMNVATSK